MYRWLIPLLVLCSANLPGVASETALPSYRWEAKEIYRYQFSKRIEVTPTDVEQPGGGRVTECRWVLVIEVESVKEDGTATAGIRFMTPKITLPPFVQLDANDSKEAPDIGQSRRNAHAMEDVLGDTHWRVTIAANGAIRMPERQPKNWRAWMERVEQVGAWPKQFSAEIGKLLDAHFSFGTADADDEWLPVLGQQPVGPRAKGLRVLRPTRLVRLDKTDADGRIRLRLLREAAGDPPPVAVPLLDAQTPPLTLARDEVKTLAGEAVFDPELGLLDSASERFSVRLTSRCGHLEQRARVWVEYNMRRLAPSLRGESKAEPGAAP